MVELYEHFDFADPLTRREHADILIRPRDGSRHVRHKGREGSSRETEGKGYVELVVVP